MRLEELKSPGQFKGAQSLRQEVFKAISFAEIAAGMTSNKSEQAKILGEFFAHAAKHCFSLYKKPITPKE